MLAFERTLKYHLDRLVTFARLLVAASQISATRTITQEQDNTIHTYVPQVNSALHPSGVAKPSAVFAA